MVVQCDIEFENSPQGTYFAGQMLMGKVTLTADKIKQVQAISLKVSGIAHTRWSEKHHDKRETFQDTEIYIDTNTFLIAPRHSDEPVIIEPGIHAFSFSCHIPTNCPSSLEGYYGHIRYMVRVALVRPWKMDQKFTRGFTVLKIMDLNYESPLLKMPTHHEMQKVFCCGPLKTAPLQINVQLPQAGYVPGQQIPVTVLVTNDTKAEITEINLRLVMMICLYGKHVSRLHVKHESIPVSKLIGDKVLPHMKKQFTYLLPVPATPPTCFNLCRIIQIAYRVEVEATVNGFMYANQEIHVPVTIGNIPLMNSVNVVTHQPRALGGGSDETDSGQRVLSEAQLAQPWAADPSIPPPTFMEAVHTPHGKLIEHEQNDYGENDFTPKYPVFNIPSPGIADDDVPRYNSVVPPTETDPNKTTWL